MRPENDGRSRERQVSPKLRLGPSVTCLTENGEANPNTTQHFGGSPVVRSAPQWNFRRLPTVVTGNNPAWSAYRGPHRQHDRPLCHPLRGRDPHEVRLNLERRSTSRFGAEPRIRPIDNRKSSIENPSPPDLVLYLVWLVLPLGRPQVRAKIFPAAIGQQAHDVLFAFEPFGRLDRRPHHGPAADAYE